MASRKQRVLGIHKADTEGKEWVVQLSRPINQLEAQGIVAVINEALKS